MCVCVFVGGRQVGQQVFATVKNGAYIDSSRNFRDLVSSMFILFQVLSGESWNDIMFDLSVSEPACTANVGNTLGDCGSSAAWIYMLFFLVGVNYVLIPFFVATVINYFFEANSESFSMISARDVKMSVSSSPLYPPGGRVHSIWA